MISSSFSGTYIDLRGTPCPVNFIRCRLVIESLGPSESLEVDLDKGEPEEMVIHGLQNEGHSVEIVHKDVTWVRLMVVCGVR